MQNAKLGILATIGLVGLSILAGCQKPATTPSVATEEKAPSAAANVPPPAPVGKRFGVMLNRDTTSTPASVTLSKGHNDQIEWVASPDARVESMEVIFQDPPGNPFQRATFKVPKGLAISSGPVKAGAGPPESNPDPNASVTYPYTVKVTTKTGTTTGSKDGDVIIKR